MFKQFTLYNFSNSSQITPINPLKYYINMSYHNVSFNNGSISFYQQLNYVPEDEKSQDQIITNINLVLLKDMWMQFYAPFERLFPLHFTLLIDSFMTQFLPKLYSMTIYQFYLYDANLTNQTIFKDLETKFKEIYYNPTYGWNKQYFFNSSDGFVEWMSVILAKDQTAKKFFMQQFNLNNDQMQKLIGENSIIQSIVIAINGTIKDAIYSLNQYTCKSNVCSDMELIAAQWSSSFLTRNQILPGIFLNTNFHEMNPKVPMYAEISQFANAQKIDQKILMSEAVNLLQRNGSNVKDSYNILNFQKLKLIMDNLDNPNLLGNLFQVNETNLLLSYITNFTITQQHILAYLFHKNLGLPYYQIYNTINNKSNETYIDQLKGKMVDKYVFNTTQNAKDYLWGYQDTYRKNDNSGQLYAQMPWLPNYVSLFQKNQTVQLIDSQHFHQMNTGLNNQSKIRVYEKYFGQEFSSSPYPLYYKCLKWVSQNNSKIEGNNELGFQLYPGDNLKVFNKVIREGIDVKKIDGKYKLMKEIQYNIGKYLFGNYFVTLKQMQFEIEQNTGLTTSYNSKEQFFTLLTKQQIGSKYINNSQPMKIPLASVNTYFNMSQNQKNKKFQIIKNNEDANKLLLLLTLIHGIGGVLLVIIGLVLLLKFRKKAKFHQDKQNVSLQRLIQYKD